MRSPDTTTSPAQDPQLTAGANGWKPRARYNACMLFLLTGDIQTGKTRWLMRQATALAAQGVRVEGVLAPGIWREHQDVEDVERFEKRGIENVLLPQGESIPFALRRDLAPVNTTSESARAMLGWEISDEALARVNAHFRELKSSAADNGHPRLTIVDELGKLELLRGGGLTEAMALLDDGPRHAQHHALIVVRASLVEQAEARFRNAWPKQMRIGPTGTLTLPN